MSGRQMSQTANFPGRQLSLQPNVQERNVLGANCPERQLSGRQMSKAPNVGRQMSGRGLAGAICLPSNLELSDFGIHHRLKNCGVQCSIQVAIKGILGYIEINCVICK